MRNWKQELKQLEQKKLWNSAVSFVKNVLTEQQNPEAYISAIYFFLNLLLEEDYKSQSLEHDELAKLLNTYFNESVSKFSDNPEYLFFVGYFISIAEFHFGQKDLSLSSKMLKKATEIEPNNPLYEWGYEFFVGDDAAIPISRSLASDKEITELLVSKGSYGEYILNAILNCSKTQTFKRQS